MSEPIDLLQIQRRNQAYALIEALNFKEYVFGGYVRDKLSNQEFSDLDICFTNEISFADWRWKLGESKGIRWDCLGFGGKEALEETDSKNFDLQKWRAVYQDGTSIDVDAYIARNKNVDISKKTPIGNKADIDINCLSQNKKGEVYSLMKDSSLASILRNIDDRKYTVLNGERFTTARLKKIESKGFDNIKNISAKKVDSNSKSITSDNKVNKTMTTASGNSSSTPSMFERFRANAVEGAYLGTAMTITDGTQAAILAFLKDQGVEDSALPAIAKFFQTNIGKAMIAVTAGTGMQFGMQLVPAIAENPHAVKIADKLQENGAALGMNAAQTLLFQYMAPVIMGALSKIPVAVTPELTKARIAGATGVSVDVLKEHSAVMEAQAIHEASTVKRAAVN